MPKDGSEISLDGKLSLDGAGMPMWLTCELTYKCPLKCPWCNNPLNFDKYKKNTNYISVIKSFSIITNEKYIK